MINQISDTLLEWVLHLTGLKEREVSFQMPHQPEGDVTTVHIYLMEISDDARRHNTGRPSVQPSLRYLLTTSGRDIRKAHELLYVLLYSALANPKFEVELEPFNSPVWAALQTPPRPAFILRVPMTHEWSPISGYRVKKVMVGLHEQDWWFGKVIGPNDTPAAQARVEVKDTNQIAYTDRIGCFSIPYIQIPTKPGEPARKKTLTVSAYGRDQDFTYEGTGKIDLPEEFNIDIPDLPEPFAKPDAPACFFGQVLYPGDPSIPAPQAMVEVKGVNQTAYTDRTGCFSIPGVAAAPDEKTLTVTTQGCKKVFTRAETGTVDSPEKLYIDIPDSTNPPI